MSKRLHSQRDLPLYVDRRPSLKRTKEQEVLLQGQSQETYFGQVFDSSQQTVSTLSSSSQLSTNNQFALISSKGKTKILNKSKFQLKFQSHEQVTLSNGFDQFLPQGSQQNHNQRYAQETKNMVQNYNSNVASQFIYKSEAGQEEDNLKIFSGDQMLELAALEKIQDSLSAKPSYQIENEQKHFINSDQALNLCANPCLEGGYESNCVRKESLSSEEVLGPLLQGLNNQIGLGSQQVIESPILLAKKKFKDTWAIIQDGSVLEFLYQASKQVTGDHPTLISEKQRIALINWIQQVGMYYKIKRSTIHLVVAIFDRILQNPDYYLSRDSNDDLEALTVMCLHIGAKAEEERPPSLKQLISHSSQTNSYAKLLQVEQKILDSLKWKLFQPNLETWGTIFLVDLLQTNQLIDIPAQCSVVTDGQFCLKYWHLCDLFCFDKALLNTSNSQYLSFSVLVLLLLAQDPNFFSEIQHLEDSEALLDALTFGKKEIRETLERVSRDVMKKDLLEEDVVRETQDVLKYLLKYQDLFEAISSEKEEFAEGFNENDISLSEQLHFTFMREEMSAFVLNK